MNRETSVLVNLRHFSSSMTARSALTEILQEELEYENKHYQPPEVLCMLVLFLKELFRSMLYGRHFD